MSPHDPASARPPTLDPPGSRPAPGRDEDRFDSLFSDVPVMAILRGAGVAGSLELARTAWDLGIEAVEVTLQSAEDREALAAVVEAGRSAGRPVGAGTVVDTAGVRDAAAVGAAFTVSPGLDLDVVRASMREGMPSLPGVGTASEVQAATNAGLRWLKAFPAVALGPDWFRTLRGPFPGVRFVATGGMDARNARAFLDAGAHVIAVGSALSDPRELSHLAEVMS